MTAIKSVTSGNKSIVLNSDISQCRSRGKGILYDKANSVFVERFFCCSALPFTFQLFFVALFALLATKTATCWPWKVSIETQRQPNLTSTQCRVPTCVAVIHVSDLLLKTFPNDAKPESNTNQIIHQQRCWKYVECTQCAYSTRALGVEQKTAIAFTVPVVSWGYFGIWYHKHHLLLWFLILWFDSVSIRQSNQNQNQNPTWQFRTEMKSDADLIAEITGTD